MITTLLELVGKLVQEHRAHGPSIFQDPTSIPRFNQLSEHLSKIDLQHVGIDLNNLDYYFKKDANAYFNILEEQDFCVGVFCLSKGSSLDLHDHPNMLVLSKYLMGSIHYRALDLVDRSQQFSLPKLLYQDEYTDVVGKKLEAIVKCDKVLRTGELNCLTPERGNIHRITALENTAFLDILLPNYNETDRICNFYKEISEGEMSEENKSDEEDGKIVNKEVMQEEKSGCLELKINKTNSKQELSDNVSVVKGKKLRQPGDKTTLLYVLPTFEQPISVIEYKGEKFDYESNNNTQDFGVQNP